MSWRNVRFVPPAGGAWILGMAVSLIRNNSGSNRIMCFRPWSRTTATRSGVYSESRHSLPGYDCFGKVGGTPVAGLWTPVAGDVWC